MDVEANEGKDKGEDSDEGLDQLDVLGGNTGIV